MSKQVQDVERMTVRFAGDSGDGMQLLGGRFTIGTAVLGNDLATLPSFPAEIRAPAGTLPGVSSFQIQFADHPTLTPGDRPDVLVAMNPAALKANLPELARGATLIVDSSEFTGRNLARVGYSDNPLTDGSLTAYAVHAIDLTGLAVAAVAEFGLPRKDRTRTRNMFALGLVSWLFGRPLRPAEDFLARAFADRPALREANLAALRAGWNFGETTETFAVSYLVPAASLPEGRYRTITGNLALAYGLVAAADRARLPLFYGSYPITPASDILHELSRLKDLDVVTFQAEDEIAAAGAALGAAFGGALAATATSGPGMTLKAETIGLAVMLELPLIVCDVQRAGPSTGMPTKPEQSDLLQALYGRNGESPVPVLAPRSPADCFDTAVEAARIAVGWRTPVIVLSDAFLATGSEPWLLPQLDTIAGIDPAFAAPPTGTDTRFQPYARDPRTLARPWAPPGTPGLAHRIGGLEKAELTGEVSYDGDNHDRMTRLRQARLDRIADALPPPVVDDPTGDADLLVVGWGSTYGTITAAVRDARTAGVPVAQLHLRHLNPFPPGLATALRRYRRLLVPELNLGQLADRLRARYLVDAEPYTRLRGLPLAVADLTEAITARAAVRHETPAGLKTEVTI